MSNDEESETKIGFYISCNDHIEFYTSLVRAGMSYREFFEPIIKRHIDGKPIYKRSSRRGDSKTGAKKHGNRESNKDTKVHAGRVIRRRSGGGTGII